MAEDLDDFEDGAGSEASGEDGGKGRNIKRLLLLVVLPLLLVVGGGAGVYLSGAADPLLAMVGLGHAKEAEEVVPEQPKATVYYDLPEMLVNLNTAGRKQSFLKIRVALELADGGDVPRVEQAMPRVVDQFQVYLRELRVEDLQGAAGMYRLREELLVRVGAAVKPAKVNDVLFREMLVQ